jgi:hypothetical protein
MTAARAKNECFCSDIYNAKAVRTYKWVFCMHHSMNIERSVTCFMNNHSNCSPVEPSSYRRVRDSIRAIICDAIAVKTFVVKRETGSILFVFAPGASFSWPE